MLDADIDYKEAHLHFKKLNAFSYIIQGRKRNIQKTKDKLISDLVFENKQLFSYYPDFSETDWMDLEWHIKEAHFLNTQQSKFPEPIRRLYRQQGKLNRMLIISADKSAQYLKSKTKSAVASSNTSLSNAREMSQKDASSVVKKLTRVDTILSPLLTMNSVKIGNSPLMKRFYREQYSINQKIVEAIELIQDITIEHIGLLNGLRENAVIEKYKSDLVWHIRESQHYNNRILTKKKWFNRVFRNQSKINYLNHYSLKSIYLIFIEVEKACRPQPENTVFAPEK